MKSAWWVNHLYYIGFACLSLLSSLSLHNESQQWEIRQSVSSDRDFAAVDLQLQVLLQRIRASISSALLTQDPSEIQWIQEQHQQILTNLLALNQFATEAEWMQGLKGPLTEVAALVSKENSAKALRPAVEALYTQVNKIEIQVDQLRRQRDESVKDQEQRLAELHAKALALNTGLILCFTAFLWLLAHQSRRKAQMHRVIESSEKLHRLIFSSLKEGIVLCTQDGFVTAANAQSAKLFAISGKEFKGRRFHEVVPNLQKLNEVNEKPRELKLVDLIDAKSVLQKPVYGFPHEGAMRWLEFSAFQLESNPGDSFQSYLISVNDVTLAIENQKTIEKQRAEMTNKSKLSALGELATGLAHEINNPLSQLMFETAVFQDQVKDGQVGTAPEKLNDFISKISGSVNRVSKIIKGIQLYARDGATDEFEDQSFVHLLDESLQILNHRMIELDIGIDRNLVDERLILHCKPTQVAQILVNLLGNSIDAIEAESQRRGGIQLSDSGETINRPWIRIETRYAPTYVALVVANSGPGIPASVRSRLFEAFFSTKPAGAGTGLGLSISRSLARSHGGDLVLAEGVKHAEFHIRLPHWKKAQEDGGSEAA
jgi:PAS domain S-box-containing protein